MIVVSIIGIAAIVGAMLPASAAATGGGTVVGTVSIAGSGIPTLNKPCAPTTYYFGPVNITGVFRAAPKNFAGTIKIPAGVTGGSGCENTNKGTGSVNTFTFSGTGSGTISGNCGGSFTRTLSVVTVNLNCSVNISGQPASATVQVRANFTPTTGNGITTNTKKASFAGVYKSS